jgi:hypothetical protein
MRRHCWVYDPERSERGVTASLEQLLYIVWTVSQQCSHRKSVFDMSELLDISYARYHP